MPIYTTEIIQSEHDGTLNAKRVNVVGGSISLATVDVQVGAVEIKDGTTDERAVVDGGALVTTVSGNVNSLATVTQAGALQTGTNYIGLATVIVASGNMNAFATVTQAGALPAGTNYLGLATVDIGTEFVPSTIISGIVSAASGFVTQFPSNTVKEVVIKAWGANATAVALGNSSATYINSYQLFPTDPPITIRIDNTNKLYLAGRDTSAVSFIGSN